MPYADVHGFQTALHFCLHHKSGIQAVSCEMLTMDG